MWERSLLFLMSSIEASNRYPLATKVECADSGNDGFFAWGKFINCIFCRKLIIAFYVNYFEAKKIACPFSSRYYPKSPSLLHYLFRLAFEIQCDSVCCKIHPDFQHWYTIRSGELNNLDENWSFFMYLFLDKVMGNQTHDKYHKVYWLLSFIVF